MSGRPVHSLISAPLPPNSYLNAMIDLELEGIRRRSPPVIQRLGEGREKHVLTARPANCNVSPGTIISLALAPS